MDVVIEGGHHTIPIEERERERERERDVKGD